MKTLILDGSHPGDALSAKLTAALLANLQARGWEAETIVVREQKIGNCAGDFFCWVRSPGLCNVNDANRVIAAKIMQSELVIALTPVTFGGYSSALKRMVDHQIQNISPFFTTIGGETHHHQRYEQYPHMLVIGWMDAPDAPAEAVFRHLVQRNAINMHARTAVCGLAIGNPSEEELASLVETWLAALDRGTSSPVPALPVASGALSSECAIRRAVLLVGSPRTTKSTSAALGNYLMAQLAVRGIAVEMLQLYTTFNTAERRRAALERLADADLVVLAFPLYVDSLPAPVIAALEQIARNRTEHSTTQRFAAIANCGFPEASHNATALAICAEFARQSGFSWAGGLALGGGGMINGVPLDELGGQAAPIKHSLALAAAALARGQSIPQAARERLARPVIPHWLYRLAGEFGWRQQAGRYGAQKHLARRPYDEESTL